MRKDMSLKETAMLSRAQVLSGLRAYATEHRMFAARRLAHDDPALYRGIRTHFGGMAAARAAAGIPRPRQPEWTKERVLAELRRIQRAGRVRMTTCGLLAAGHTSLVSGIYKHFGSITRARRLTRIPEPGRRTPDTCERWDEDRVIAEIRDRHRRHLPLAGSKVPENLRSAAWTYCGGWQAAIEMAGFNYEEIRLMRRPWTREELLELVRHAVEQRTRNPDGPPLTTLVAHARTPIKHQFGKLPAAVRAAGFDPTRVMKYLPSERLNVRDLVAELRAAVAREPTLTCGEFFRTPLGRQARARFGSISAAIEQIGVDRWPARRREPRLSAPRVIEGLQARHRQGRALTFRATLVDESRLVHGALKRFGTWRRAVQAAGLG